MRVAINGMGRIGRLLFRRLLHHPDIHIVAVNDIMPAKNLAYLLKYDSVYGTTTSNIELKQNELIADKKCIHLFNTADPEQLPWKALGIDMVLECSGRFTTATLASKHLKAGAKKILLSTTGSEDIPLMIYGHNHEALCDKSVIISPGGCMTNCTTHIIRLLQQFEISSVQINVIHSYTSRQELIDTNSNDFRRGRAAAESIIPVKVDLADSLQKLFPSLQNKIAVVTTRVPVANGALADFSFSFNKPVTAKIINNCLAKASQHELKGILEYTEDEIVSADIKANTHSAVVDGTLSSAVGNQVKLFAFFDNEFGYTSRMIDWMMYLKKLHQL